MENRLFSSLTSRSKHRDIIHVWQPNARNQFISDTVHELYDGIDIINAVFSTQLIPVFTIHLVDLIFLSFSALKIFLNPTFGALHRAHIISLMTYFLLALMVAPYFACSTVAESSETMKIIGRIMATGQLSPESVNFFSQLLTQFRFRKPMIENECFTVDWRLFVSVSL